MTKKILVLAGVAGVAVIAAGVLFWYAVLRSDAPPKVTLAEALGSIGTSTVVETSSNATTPAASTQASSASGVNGTWSPDTAKANFLGYRVGEELARIGTQTAVGRTSAVTGEVGISGDKVTSAKLTADLTQLKSDSNMRDGQLRNQAIETSKYPRATFELTDAVTLPSTFATGGAFETTLKGKLTLHGVSKDVSIPVQGQLKDGLIVVVGSIDIKFADYSISKPNGASVLSIEDHGIMEFQLFLKHS